MINLFIWLGGQLLLSWLGLKQYLDKFYAIAWFFVWFLWESWKLVGDLTIRVFTQYTNAQGLFGSAPGQPGGEAALWMARANTFFPCDEAVHMFAAFVSLWAAVGIYRLIKSWIPTLGGGS